MIKQVLALSLALLSLHTSSKGDGNTWNGDTNSATHSVEVSGNQTYHYPPATPQRSYTAPTETATNTSGPVSVLVESSASALLPRARRQSQLVTINDVERLNIDGGHISLQPSRGWAYVNKAVYLQSDTKPITKETTMLGSTVTITATPVSYTWHCGDRHSFTTKNAGGTWSQKSTATHSYARPGTYTLSADITWKATYTVNGHTYPVDGTITTTSARQRLKIVEAETVLTH